MDAFHLSHLVLVCYIAKQSLHTKTVTKFNIARHLEFCRPHLVYWIMILPTDAIDICLENLVLSLESSLIYNNIIDIEGA